MVAGHVIGYTSNTGMRVADDSGWRYFYHTFEYFRMPLFTVLSGFVYGLRPYCPGQSQPFVLGKIKRILVPYVVVKMLVIVSSVVTGSLDSPLSVQQIGYDYLHHVSYLWFLPAIFECFLMVALLESARWLDRTSRWSAVLLASLAITYFAKLPDFIFLSDAFYLLPFFLLGLGINRFRKWGKNKWVLACLLTAFVAGISLQQLAWFSATSLPVGKETWLGLLVGLTGTAAIIKTRFKNDILARLGDYSYSIYLYHVFGNTACRLALKHIGVQNEAIIFFLCLLSGLAAGIVADKMLSKRKVVSLLFLGKSTARASGDQRA